MHSMKRDVTVWLSLVMIMIPWLVGLAMGMPRNNEDNTPGVFHVFFWIIFLGTIRAIVLWFQTLIHGVKYAKEENRVAVVLAHFFLGPIMAYAYYLCSRMNAKQAPDAAPKADM